MLLIRVGKLAFPTDFVVFDMEVDHDVPINLGMLFLATGGDLIDVGVGNLILRLDDEYQFNIMR